MRRRNIVPKGRKRLYLVWSDANDPKTVSNGIWTGRTSETRQWLVNAVSTNDAALQIKEEYKLEVTGVKGPLQLIRPTGRQICEL